MKDPKITLPYFEPPYAVNACSDANGADVFLIEDAHGEAALMAYTREVADAIVAALNVPEP